MIITPARVMEVVGRRLDVEPRFLASSTRGRKEVAWARAVSMWTWAALNRVKNKSEIGRAFGRDRTTVRVALARVVAALASPSFDLWVRETLAEIDPSEG